MSDNTIERLGLTPDELVKTFTALAIDARAYGTDPDRQTKVAADITIAYINALLELAKQPLYLIENQNPGQVYTVPSAVPLGQEN